MPLKKLSKSPFVYDMRYFLKWSIISIIIGLTVGFVGSMFSKSIALVTFVWHKYDWTLYLLPFLGIIIVFLYNISGEAKPKGTNLVIESISAGEKITSKMAPLIFISTVLTHLGSASAGKEGAALQLGGSMGSIIARIGKFSSEDKNIAIMCGMSACFAALFGTPITATIFSMELISVGIIYYAALIPCMFSAFIGAAVSSYFGIHPETFILTEYITPDIKTIFSVIVLGILCSILSIIFCVLMHNTEELYNKFFKNQYLRIIIAALIFIVLTLLSGTRIYNGSGFELIELALDGKIGYEAFLMKMIFTLVVLCAGFKGGEIVPALAIGATFGAGFAMLTGMNIALAAECGMIACFVGVTNCPISSILLAIELFGISGLEYYVIVIAISFTLSGYYGLYSSQKFAYYKTRPRYINENAKKIRQIRDNKKD